MKNAPQVDEKTHAQIKGQVEAMHGHLREGTGFNVQSLLSNALKVLQLVLDSGLFNKEQLQSQLMEKNLIPKEEEKQKMDQGENQGVNLDRSDQSGFAQVEGKPNQGSIDQFAEQEQIKE
jgi:hypothetical protein